MSEQITERPILFSAPMVRAILAGTKTQTREAMKPQPKFVNDLTDTSLAMFWNWRGQNMAKLGREEVMRMCPYGQPGDRLWVREAWQAELRWDWTKPCDIEPGSPIYFEFGDEAVPACAGKKRPSIHMPRWASRITLEITGVRVERLQEISESAAEAEGVGFLRNIPDADETMTAHELFECLWDSINGPGSWDANPWVWVVEFKRLQGGAA